MSNSGMPVQPFNLLAGYVGGGELDRQDGKDFEQISRVPQAAQLCEGGGDDSLWTSHGVQSGKPLSAPCHL